MLKRFRLAMLGVVIVSLLAFSQSAFAMPGWDTESSAFVRPYGSSTLTNYLSSAADEDWYYYTNNTGSNLYVSTSLDSASYPYHFDLEVKIKYDALHSTNLFAAQEAGMTEYLYNIQVPPGATIYYRVTTKNWNSVTEFYTLTVNMNT